MTMWKYLIALSVFILTPSQSIAQDTITIQHDDFTLAVQKVHQGAKPFYKRKSSSKKQVTSFHFRGSLMNLLEFWIEAAAFEKIEYEIDGSRYKLRLRNFEDSSLIFNQRFDIVMTSKDEDNLKTDFKQIQKAAFEAFIDLTEVELTKVKETKTFWELKLIDESTSIISMEQNKFWSRSELEDYVYYERIDIRRIADLLDRKLDNFVRPISPNYLKFDIKMPYSNDFFDLKYAMIEHGFELTEVTKEIEVWVIKI